jgi:hypothetical protein
MKKTQRRKNKKRGGNGKKSVKFNSPQNKTHNYILTAAEKKSKITKKDKKHYKCDPRFFKFPCKLGTTLFTNKDEYMEYLQLIKERKQLTKLQSNATEATEEATKPL